MRIFKYRLKDKSARKQLLKHAFAVNQIWNYCNAYQKNIEDRYRAGAPKRNWPTGYDFDKLCGSVGKELGVHQQTISCVCVGYAANRDRAKRSIKFRNSYGRSRSKGWIPFQRQSRQIGGNSVTYLGKTYRYFGSKRRPLPENARGGYFTEDNLGRWYVCFLVEVENKIPSSGGQIGIDLGLKSFAALSDGEKIKAPKYFSKLEQKLGTAQRANNKKGTCRIHAKIKNCRNDFLHKLSTRLAGRNALIAVGNVSAKQLAKTKLAKSVMDASWSTFRAMLKYKAKTYIEVDEKFTTQMCSSCGVIPASSPKGMSALGIRQWECSDCGASHDRDVNAAKNILIAALGTQRLVGGSLCQR